MLRRILTRSGGLEPPDEGDTHQDREEGEVEVEVGMTGADDHLDASRRRS
jgi:hypothetical protein